MSGELITGDGQLQYKDYLLGDNNITFLDAINGWDDLPSVDSGNTLRPASHGAWVGKKIAGQRIITWEGRFSASESLWAYEIKRLKTAFSLPNDTEEYDIVIRLHDDSYLAFGTVSARLIPGDRQYGYYGATLNIQFECSDPRRYSLGENSWTLSMPAASDNGLIYPLGYPLDYGIEQTPSSGTLVNDGDVMTPIIIEFTGPITNPGIINSTLGVKIQFNIILTVTDTLTINTRTGSVLLNGSADRLYTRTINSSPILSFGLLPGANNLQLVAEDWDAPSGATITWRDATL
jgi:hypothetical protein